MGCRFEPDSQYSADRETLWPVVDDMDANNIDLLYEDFDVLKDIKDCCTKRFHTRALCVLEKVPSFWDRKHQLKYG